MLDVCRKCYYLLVFELNIEGEFGLGLMFLFSFGGGYGLYLVFRKG